MQPTWIEETDFSRADVPLNGAAANSEVSEELQDLPVDTERADAIGDIRISRRITIGTIGVTLVPHSVGRVNHPVYTLRSDVFPSAFAVFACVVIDLCLRIVVEGERIHTTKDILTFALFAIVGSGFVFADDRGYIPTSFIIGVLYPFVVPITIAATISIKPLYIRKGLDI